MPLSFVGTSSDGNIVATLLMPENGAVDYALLDTSTGAVLWRFPLGDGVVPARPNFIVTLDDGHLIGWKPVE